MSRAPKLSIIVPCYKVQGYLRQCLDSILSQLFSDFELIAIDDASPDHSGEILDEYAAADRRVQVVHLEQNVGLGPARNIGMDHAAGEYLLFVDSDDWVAEGALGAIAERLRETKPDLLFFDFARTEVFGTGPRVGQEHWRPPAPDVSSLRESPELMGRMMTAWNKAYRREFLIGRGLRFPSGFYEDWPVHYPALMLAERISVLNRLCYYYRQRGGAITKSQSRKHLDALDQMERVFALMDSHSPELDEFRGAMFSRAMWHYLIILRHEERLSSRARKEFFLRMSDHYRRFRPTDFERPKGRDGLRFKVIEHRAYWLFRVLRAAGPRSVLRRLIKGMEDRVRSSRRAFARYGRRLLYRVQLLFPVDESLALFAAYWSRSPAGNPLAIFERVGELAPNMNRVWVVRASDLHRVPAGTPFVVDGSAAHHRLVARAKYIVSNANFPVFARKRKGSIWLQAQHGTPLKTMGSELKKYPVASKSLNFKLLEERSGLWDFSLSSNLHSTEVWERVYRHNFESLEYGYPSNDRFYTADAAEMRRVRKDLGITPEAVAILYAPTHREYQARYESRFDVSRVAAKLAPDHVLLIRAHYYYDQQEHLAGQPYPQIIDVSDWPSVEDLCLACDVLVSDYSSIIFDFANLNRPIVVYADDYEIYRSVRGVYFDILAEPPGAVTTTEDELVDVLRGGKFNSLEAQERLQAFRRRFCPWDDGHAAERVVRRVFLDEEPPPPIPFEERTHAPSPREVFAYVGGSAGPGRLSS